MHIDYRAELQYGSADGDLGASTLSPAAASKIQVKATSHAKCKELYVGWDPYIEDPVVIGADFVIPT